MEPYLGVICAARLAKTLRRTLLALHLRGYELRILIFVEYYLPGYKSGGPIQSIANLVERLGEQADFYILTRDRDRGDTTAYPNLDRNSWNEVGKAKVYYAAPSQLSVSHLRQLIRDVQPNVIYLNSFFSPLPRKVLLLRRLCLIPPIGVILAPRGELSQGALKIKARKKKPYIALAGLLGIYQNLLWEASSEMEEREIRCLMGNHVNVYVSNNLPANPLQLITTRSRQAKQPQKARFIFVSRITPKKNLLFALQLLPSLQGEADIDIYGPIADQEYWNICLKAIKAMPAHIKVAYRGAVPHERVVDLLQDFDFFLLPTFGENFGHVIFEALSSGCPVLLSDKTPWHSAYVEPLRFNFSQVGWSTALDDVDRWQKVLQTCIDLDNEQYQAMSSMARQLSGNWYEHFARPDRILSRFQTAAECGAPRLGLP